jgi:DnaJ-class molecular chaperone
MIEPGRIGPGGVRIIVHESIEKGSPIMVARCPKCDGSGRREGLLCPKCLATGVVAVPMPGRSS